MRFNRPIYKSTAGLIGFFAFLAVFFFAGPIKAQFSNNFTTFNIIQASNSFNISNYVYVTEDKDGTLLWSEVLKRHVSNIRGERVKGDTINLSFKKTAHYLVFSLKNKTQNTDWVLDFGQRTSGRVGIMDDFYLYNASSKQMIADTVSPDANVQAVEKHVIGSSIPFELDPGKSALFLLYVRPDNGMPFTMPLRVSSQKYAAKELIQTNTTHNVVLIFCIIGVGFYFGLFLIRQRWEYLVFGTYFIILSRVYGRLNDHFFAFSEYDSLIFALLLNLGCVAILWMNATFLNFKKHGDKASLSLTYMLSLYALASIVVTFLWVPVGHPSRLLFYTAPSIICIGFVVANAVLKSLKKRKGALFLSIGWLSFGFGVLASQMAYLDIVDPSKFAHIGTWISVVPQCLFFIAATAIRYRSLENRSYEQKAERSNEADSLVRIQRSKEAADQQRLLRVIEREREVMEELREREAKRTEEMRKAKVAADEANRAKSAFLAIVSHEIRTPMTGILGMVRLMMKTQLTKDQSEYAITIQESGETMLALLNDILDFEKIESGKMDIEEINFDLKRLVSSVVTLMSGHAREKGIKLESDISGKIPSFVTGDPTRIRQVLLNLVGNAIKFTDKGGVTLLIRAHTIEGAENPNAAYDIYFGIKDTGIGISEEGQKNLFNPFEQADSSISRKFGGTGLGLAICKALIGAMGSEINLSSKEGEGSTFSFVLRLGVADSDHTENQSAAPIQTPTEEAKTYDVLLCEDNEINQKVVTGFLGQGNHKVDIAGDGEEAVTSATGEKKYDLILMDIEMPKQNGLQASIQIRQTDGVNKETPIAALSGNVSDADRQRCFNSGMNDHLAKPVNPDALEKLLGAIETKEFAHPDIVIIEQSEEGAAPEEKKSSKAKTKTKAKPKKKKEEKVEDSFSESIEEEAPVKSTKGKKDDNKDDIPVFDMAMLQNLKDNLPADQIEELLDGLFVKGDELVESLKMAAANDDMKEIIARAHELKGMTGNFGLTRLSKMAASLEEDARNGLQKDYKAEVETFIQASEDAKKSIEDWRKA